MREKQKSRERQVQKIRKPEHYHESIKQSDRRRRGRRRRRRRRRRRIREKKEKGGEEEEEPKGKVILSKGEE